MKTLRKLLLVACAAFFFTSCEETYNDKLFWPGELSQEYGSYIKPSTLDLTYSGEKLIGKSVSFITEDSKKGTLTTPSAERPFRQQEQPLHTPVPSLRKR